MKMKKKVLVYAVTGLLAVSLIQSSGATVAAKKKVAINKKKVTLTVGKTVKLSVKGVSAKKVTWSSSKKAVAAVNKKGVVTAKKAGKANVIAKVSGKKYTCTVTVKSKSAGSSSASSKVNWTSVGSNFDKLAEYVTANGTESEETISITETTPTDLGSLTLQVSYDSDNEALIFQKSERDAVGVVYSLSMTITKDEPETAAVECQITLSGVTYVGESELEIAEYASDDDGLGFDFDAGTSSTETASTSSDDGDEASGPSDDVVDDLDSQGTSYLNGAIEDWNSYLGNAGAGVSLKNLGFVSFKF